MRLPFLLPLLWAGSALADWQPRVTSKEGNLSFDLQPFDDSTTLLRTEENLLKISDDNGITWKTVEEVGTNVTFFQIDGNYRGNRAFVLSRQEQQIYQTADKGASWVKVNLPPLQLDKNEEIILIGITIESNPFAEGDVILQIFGCYQDDTFDNGLGCKTFSFVTANGIDFSLLKVPETEEGHVADQRCRFLTMGSDHSQSGVRHDILCEMMTNGETSPSGMLYSREVAISSDYGKTFEPLSQFEDYTILRTEVVGDYAVIITVDDRYNRHSSAQLWVSRNGRDYTRATVNGELRSNVHLNPLSPSSKRIEAMWSNPSLYSAGASFLISDSEGLNFAPLKAPIETAGHIMTEPLAGLPGVILMTSYPSFREEQAVSLISFDDGHSWSDLKIDDPNNELNCDLNSAQGCSLISAGRFSFFRDQIVTPGISTFLGFVADSGSHAPNDVKTFLTTDGGYSWRKVFDFPTQIAYGDHGNVIIAVPFLPGMDNDPAGEFYYSLDQGESWTEYEFPDPIVLMMLTSTTPDGSGTTFVLQGVPDRESENSNAILYIIDFSDAFEGHKCGKSDLFTWYSNDGGCINGAKHGYKRRKKDAKCLIKEVFKDLNAHEEICNCSPIDYECSPNFSRNDFGECVIDYNLLESSETCRNRKDNKIELMPMKLERGNKCKKPLKFEAVEIDCGSDGDEVGNGDVRISENILDFELKSYQFFDTIADETVLFRTEKNDVLLSHDSGRTMKRVGINDKITEVVFNPYFNTSAYLFGAKNELYITHDRAVTFTSTKLPDARQLNFPLAFHAKDVNSFIFYGGKNCETFFDPKCHAVAYITRDGGETFSELLQGASVCEFVGSLYDSPHNPDMIMCLVKEKGTNEHSIYTSSDFFINDVQKVFDKAIGFVSAGEYTVVAVPQEGDELRAYVTVDGKTFAEAKLPAELKKGKQQAYTVLGSEKGAIFLHLTTQMAEGLEYGALMKSNSNGTSFVTLERAVNRGTSGFVDFEKAEGLEGIILINTVQNAEEIASGEETHKKLRSKISFNDGADWTYLNPPQTDSEGKPYACNSKTLSSCSLNLHGFTERKDSRDTFSSGSALGFMIGVGNVGEYLLPTEECSTFLTIDGGFHWKEIKKGPYQWEYGDHGSVIVLLKSEKLTDSIVYSLDAGKSWAEFKFSTEEILVEDIVTTPQDSAMRFLIIGKSSSVTGEQTRIFTLDFTPSFKRQCVLGSEDYAYHSFGDCLFGHQAEYLQKVNYNCYNGAAPLKDKMKITKNCPCKRSDFECDYNHYKANDGTCKLVKNAQKPNGEDMCLKDSNMIEYFDVTGYRKIPLSTCEGGLQLDRSSKAHPCPGKEKEFKKLHRVGTKRIILIIILPIIVFLVATWFVYDRGIKRNGGISRFGEIRLGDEDLVEENWTDKVVNTVVRVGVAGFSGLVAVKQLSQRNFTNSWRTLKTRFQRSRDGPSYSSLTHDQFLDEADELLAGHDEDANDLTSFIDHEDNFDVSNDDHTPETSPSRPYSDDDDTAAGAENTGA